MQASPTTRALPRPVGRAETWPCLQPFHPSQRYKATADRSVISMTSEDVGLWGNNRKKRLYKQSACMLHAPGEAELFTQLQRIVVPGVGADHPAHAAGGAGNSKPLLDMVVPRYKAGQTLLFESTQPATPGSHDTAF